jgi:hypothetical protein
MAKLFTTGTVNQPDAGSVGLAMANILRDDIIAHPAWELVEEFTPSGGASRWMVFKCLAAESGLPADFFLVLGRTLGSGRLEIAICEAYDSSTHTMQFYSPGNAGTVQAFDAQGRRTETYVLSTIVLPAGSTTPNYVFWTPSGVSTKYWTIVTEDGVTVAFNGASNSWFFGGVYVPLVAQGNDMPLIQAGLQGGSGYWGITRNPAVSGTSQKGYATTVSASTTLLGFTGRMDVNDALQDNQRVVAEVGLKLYANSFTADPPLYGSVLGKFKGMRQGGGNPPAGFAFGDAYVLNGTLWVPYVPTDDRIWDTGVPD